MMWSRDLLRAVTILCVGLALAFPIYPVEQTAHAGEAFAHPAFEQTWRRADAAVQAGDAVRTYLWGPEPRSGPVLEPYKESPSGQRLVQYFDKSRMELTNPQGDASAFYYVSNGLLVSEMVTGAVQVGDTAFDRRTPAAIGVAGDPDDPLVPTYATFAPLLARSPLAVGQPITATVTRTGESGTDTTPAGKATAKYYVGETRHTIADVFWKFMIEQQGTDATGKTATPFYATGLPITEAYWTIARVNGQPRLVLVQLFERRVLTYTPGNRAGFQVEAGNTGSHYRLWRESLSSDQGAPPPSLRSSASPPTATPPVTKSATPTLTAIIAEVFPDGDATTGDANGERVVILNGTDQAVNMSGWTLGDTRGHTYTFDRYVLPQDGSVTLSTGRGINTDSERYWNQSTGVFDDIGPETLTLRDANGITVDAFAYP